MKINKIEIDNFGTLSNVSYDLRDGVNYICEDNGFGKTTLGAFIKVMFYGFDKEKSKVADRERTKYKPWQGGVYGGTIEFEVNGKEYVLQRLFKEKQSDDRSSLRDKKTKIESKDFNVDNLGKELFNIDANSFARTMFLSQNEYDLSSFNDIDSKIGNMIDDTDDMNNFETAIDALESKINSISKTRKPYGQIENNDSRIQQLKQDIKEKPSLEASIKTATIDLDEANDYVIEKTAEKKEIESKLQAIGNKKDIASKKKEYDIITQSYKEENYKLHTLLSYFNNTEPDENEINNCEKRLTEIKTKKALLQENVLTDEEKVLQAKLNAAFENLDIDVEDFDETQRILAEQTKLKNKINSLSLSENEIDLINKETKYFSEPFDTERNQKIIELWNGEREQKKRNIDSLTLSYSERENLDTLRRQFEANSVDVSQVDSYIKMLTDNKPASEIVDLKNQIVIEQTKNVSKPNIIGIALMTILIAIGAIVGFVLKKLIIGIVLMLLGVVLMLAMSISTKSKANEEKKKIIDELNNKIKQKEEILNKQKQGAEALLNSYGIVCDSGNAAIELNNLKRNYVQYLDLKNKQKDLENKHSEDKKRIVDIENAVYNYLKHYEITANETNALPMLHELQSRYDRYSTLKSKNELPELIDAKNEYDVNDGIIKSFFSKFGIINIKEEEYFDKYSSLVSSVKKKDELNKKSNNYSQINALIEELNKEIIKVFVKYGKTGQFDWDIMLNEMQSQCTLYNEVKEKCIKIYQKKQNFEKENPNYVSYVTITEEVDEVSLEQLTKQSSDLQNEIDYWREKKELYSNNLTALNDKYNELCDKEGEVESLKKVNVELSEKLNILKQAHKHLIDAKETLNSKYGTPIADSLTNYFDELATNADFKVSIDANKELIVTAQGAERDIRSLSKGYGDIVDICFRMSLTDAMYTGEKPLVILDDPFINLDENKIENGLNFIDKIGNNHQVLYLTCHSSRMPK